MYNSRRVWICRLLWKFLSNLLSAFRRGQPYFFFCREKNQSIFHFLFFLKASALNYINFPENARSKLIPPTLLKISSERIPTDVATLSQKIFSLQLPLKRQSSNSIKVSAIPLRILWCAINKQTVSVSKYLETYNNNTTHDKCGAKMNPIQVFCVWKRSCCPKWRAVRVDLAKMPKNWLRKGTPW